MASELGQPLSDCERLELRRAVEADGEQRLQRETGVSRNSLVRCLSGLRVQPGTAALVRSWLREHRGSRELPAP